MTSTPGTATVGQQWGARGAVAVLQTLPGVTDPPLRQGANQPLFWLAHFKIHGKLSQKSIFPQQHKSTVIYKLKQRTHTNQNAPTASLLTSSKLHIRSNMHFWSHLYIFVCRKFFFVGRKISTRPVEISTVKISWVEISRQNFNLEKILITKIFFGSYSKFRHQKILATFLWIMYLFVGSEISTGPVEISKVEISGIEISEIFY